MLPDVSITITVSAAVPTGATSMPTSWPPSVTPKLASTGANRPMAGGTATSRITSSGVSSTPRIWIRSSRPASAAVVDGWAPAPVPTAIITTRTANGRRNGRPPTRAPRPAASTEGVVGRQVFHFHQSSSTSVSGKARLS